MSRLPLLKRALDALSIQYDERTIETFNSYRSFILEWNEKVNLTAIKDPEEFEVKHFMDSISICEEDPFIKADSIIDVGTGAGFPGIPLAILFPGKNFVLIDSLNKKIRILEEAADKLGLHNVRFCHGRAEDLGHQKEHREVYDLCVSRAVAELSILSEYCLPFVKPGGYFAPYKTGQTKDEVNQAEQAMRALGGTFERTAAFHLPGWSPDHTIFWIKKEKKTPSKYPRKAGTPSKNPL